VGPDSSAFRRFETWILFILVALVAVLRVVYAFGYPFDSDEPQHLHVAWAWTKGLLPYRDVFDNHAPLFHLLSAPLVALIGESPRILVLMRLAMIPVFAACLLGSYLLGRMIAGRAAGAWAAAICALSPTFFFKTIEYRTDVLWAALWALGIVVLLGGAMTARRGIFSGLLLGACLAVSLKTVMLLSALLVASLLILLAAPRKADGMGRSIARFASAVAAGIVLPPAALALWFTLKGAFKEMLYCTVQHNLLSDVGRWGYSKRLYLLLPILALLLVAARFIARHFPQEGVRVAFLLLLAGSQYLLLSTVWPVHTRQDLLPFYPLFTPLLAWIVLASWSAVRRARLLLPLLACLELLILPALSPLTTAAARAQETRLSQVLRLTDPDDYVLDLKGQAVFRNRPFYYALETMTLERMKRGLIEDTIPERCVETRTCVASAEIGRFPPRARRFLEENYVTVGAWRVAGRMLEPEPAGGAGRVLSFEVTIPARYAVVGEDGAARGSLDGVAYDGPRALDPGPHRFVPTTPAGGRLAVVWAQAVERGFSPFAREREAG
jgi:hypothetical protein